MAILCEGEWSERAWRHSRIIEVATEPGGAYSFVDVDDMGRLWIDAEDGVIPRVGDPVSYYGRFCNYRYTYGIIVEALVIGERMVWDNRQKEEG